MKKIHVIHHLADLMHNAIMAYAPVYQNFREIHILDVDLNVSIAWIASKPKHALEINVWILVPELVAKMPNALLLIIYQCVIAFKVLLATHLLNVDPFQKFRQHLALHLRADLIANVGK